MRVKVKVINKAKHSFGLPCYATKGSSGMDVRASLDSLVMINPGERALIPTGIHVGLPEGYEIQIRPRSGLALKKGISVLNTPSTIDQDYIGEIHVVLINHSSEVFIVENGDRIAQLVLAEVPVCEWEETDFLSDTERGNGGFGHSGTR